MTFKNFDKNIDRFTVEDFESGDVARWILVSIGIGTVIKWTVAGVSALYLFIKKRFNK